MKILMVSAEVVPFAKTGGLADAVSALAGNLSEQGHDVKIVMPRYYKIDRKKLTPLPGAMGVPVGGGQEWTEVYSAPLPGFPKATVYFIDHEQCFGRDGVYGPTPSSDFPDNTYRFSLLAHGAFQVCNKLGWFPDIVHAHDWSAGLATVLLKHVCRWQEKFRHTASVYTIHNMGYQGVFGKDKFPDLGLDWGLYYGAGFERNGALNFLQAGISCADMVTTVSPTYAHEIQTPEGGFGLDGLLRVRSDVVRGIVNGVDKSVWNPATDSLIPARFGAGDMAGKAACKAALQKEFGLPVRPDVPLVGMVGRLVSQKGIAEVFAPSYGSVYSICSTMDVQFAVIGTGERWCEDEIRELQSKLPNFRAKIGYSERVSHLVEAGADFFLMPSQYEPCGLNQMYSELYGTLPIVRRTGGLADTVENYNEQTGEGTGFMFDSLTPGAIYDTVGWAVWAYYNRKEHIRAMQERAMAMDFSWKASCDGYVEVYKEALSRGCS
ncbi:glycogen synthase [Treponema saccharophilum]|uniref:Glycogen synthase n=1 Tax=Treponema saccharophilum DSM 2985 TaxID=907348 RepID=H7EMF2_9SPIR|nr:glycogen synthase [Treponema saccharophilum]EIC01237.1 glycogen synthase (ADP-glucose) [Treponema saccharophilum DSM 2985]BDC95991.1 glycogen synthase [Treponema saccharophilum]